MFHSWTLSLPLALITRTFAMLVEESVFAGTPGDSLRRLLMRYVAKSPGRQPCARSNDLESIALAASAADVSAAKIAVLIRWCIGYDREA